MKMYTRLKKQFLNIPVRRKVCFAFLLVGMLPFLLYLILASRYTGRLIANRERSLTESAFSQAISAVSNELQTYNDLSNYLFNDNSLLKALNDSYGDNYFKMYKAYQDTIEPLFQTYYALHPDLQDITIYSSCDLHPYNGYVRPMRELVKQPWYSQIQGLYVPTWTVEEKNGSTFLYSTRLIGDVSRYKSSNYLSLRIDYEALFSPFHKISEDDYSILILDKSGLPVFSKGQPDIGLISQLSEGKDSSRYLFLSDTLIESGWTVYYCRSLISLNRYISDLTGQLYVFGLVILGLLAVTLLLISATVISPIETLTGKIRQVRSSEISAADFSLDIMRQDEIGVLFRNYAEMMQQLHRYIEDELKHELERKSYQQKILYAQINPHFLYNALSLINSRAILAGQEDISEMVVLLSTFYRTALNHGQDMTTLDNELKNIRSYLQLQQFSYSEPIRVSFHTDPSLALTPVPNFILQPLVENALDHGLKNSNRPGKALSVCVGLCGTSSDTPSCIRILVEDNGAGMDEETVRTLLVRQTPGYGMKNVNDRLRLLYGDSYVLNIRSCPGEGTQIILKIPIT